MKILHSRRSICASRPCPRSRGLARARSGPSTSLLSERMGLLAGRSAPSLHDDHRMEDWIASHLDLGELSSPGSQSPWARIIDNLPGMKRKPDGKARAQIRRARRSIRGRASRSPTSVESRWCGYVEKTLVKESQIRELARDLLDLIAAGNHRIVLEFSCDRASGELDGIRRRRSFASLCVRRWRRTQDLWPSPATGPNVPDRRRGASRLAPRQTRPPRSKAHGPRPRARGHCQLRFSRRLTRAADVLPIRGGSPSDAADVDNLASPSG